MLKRVLATVVLALCLFSTACDANKSAKPSGGTDYTVKFHDFNPDQYPNVISSGTTASLPSGFFSLDDNWSAAVNVVYGKVVRIRNFDENGYASTLYDFEIGNVYKGNLKKGDTITVDAPGGYLRLEQMLRVFPNERYKDWSKDKIESTVFYQTFEGAPLPKAGDNYFVFLDQARNDFPDMVSGLLYYESGVFRSRYYYNKEGRLERYCPEPGFYMTAERADELRKQYGDHYPLKNEDPTYTFNEIDVNLKNRK